MSEVLLVPGALLPADLAAHVLDRTPAKALPWWLGPDVAAAYQDTRLAAGAHWSWIAHHLSQGNAPASLANAVWLQSALGRSPPWLGRAAPVADATCDMPDFEPRWIALCDPVHLSITTNGIVLSTLEDNALDTDDTQALLALANHCLDDPQGPVVQSGRRVRLLQRAGQWFALSDRHWDLLSTPLDVLCGARVHARHMGGPDAALLQAAMNDIQMRWHDHDINLAREARGLPAANSLWIHAPARWSQQERPSQALAELLYDGSARSPRDESQTIRWVTHLWTAWRRRDWNLWQRELPALLLALQEHIDARRHPHELAIVLCGNHGWRTLSLGTRTHGWWKRLLRPRSDVRSKQAMMALLRDA